MFIDQEEYEELYTRAVTAEARVVELEPQLDGSHRAPTELAEFEPYKQAVAAVDSLRARLAKSNVRAERAEARVRELVAIKPLLDAEKLATAESEARALRAELAKAEARVRELEVCLDQKQDEARALREKIERACSYIEAHWYDSASSELLEVLRG